MLSLAAMMPAGGDVRAVTPSTCRALTALFRLTGRKQAAIGGCDVQIDTKYVFQFNLAGIRDFKGARRARSRNPSEFQKPSLQLGADQSPHMIAPLAPVQAGPAEDALAAAVGFKPGSEVAEKAVACVGKSSAICTQMHVIPRDQRVRDRNAEPSGHVVVATARKAQCFIARGARSMSRWHFQGRDGDHAFQHLGHER